MAQERVLDVRATIKAGGEPFDDIMQAVRELGPGEDLVLLAPFDPVPLYSVLGPQGFAHTSEALPSGDFRVRFARQAS